jgi:DNA repair exonuclease
MKFIHAADLHLDTPFVSINNYSKDLQESLKKSTYSAALKVFQTAIEESVDFVILAGDTFDNTEHSLNTQMFLKEQFEELQKYDIQVYMVYGNHDYFRNSLAIIDFPSNVHIFDQNVSTMDLTTKDGQTVAITGFSYYQRHIAG